MAEQSPEVISDQVAVADSIVSDQPYNVVGAKDERLARVRDYILRLKNVIKNEDHAV